MTVEKAKAHFLAKPGHEKLNCGQSILNAFKERFPHDQGAIALFEKYGGGRAPGGECGALYAARTILEKHHPEKLKECEKYFSAVAGSSTCREIKSLRRLSCLGCVEKIAEFIEEI